MISVSFDLKSKHSFHLLISTKTFIQIKNGFGLNNRNKTEPFQLDKNCSMSFLMLFFWFDGELYSSQATGKLLETSKEHDFYTSSCMRHEHTTLTMYNLAKTGKQLVTALFLHGPKIEQ